MTRPPHLRAGLISATLVVLAVAAWLLVAPTQIGGETSYVTTSGISMAPRFHSGDLAVVRPAAEYRVGDIVAYHSKTLHLVVLHRIIAVKDGRFVTKGDNNDFTDPDHPARADVVGKLAFRVPHGGTRPALAAHAVHGRAAVAAGWRCCCSWAPSSAAAAATAAGRAAERGTRQLEPLRTGRDRHAIYDTYEQHHLHHLRGGRSRLPRLRRARLHAPGDQARPADKTPYTEKVSFGYHAKASAGPVYPDGVVSTGDPIFVKLVHGVRVKAHYRLAGQGPASRRRHDGGRPAPLEPDRLEPHHPARRPQALHGRLRRRRRVARHPRLRSLIRKVEKLTGGTGRLRLHPRGHAARAPGRDARQPAAHQRLRAGAQAPARRPQAASRRRPRRSPARRRLRRPTR